MEKELDNIDKSILKILQKNARTPVKDIAKEVFLSSPAVSARQAIRAAFDVQKRLRGVPFLCAVLAQL